MLINKTVRITKDGSSMNLKQKLHVCEESSVVHWICFAFCFPLATCTSERKHRDEIIIEEVHCQENVSKCSRELCRFLFIPLEGLGSLSRSIPSLSLSLSSAAPDAFPLEPSIISSRSHSFITMNSNKINQGYICVTCFLKRRDDR